MDRSGFQRSFILGFVLCLVKGQDTCAGYDHKNDTEFVYGVLGENVTLSCELQSYCVIRLWAFRTSPVKYLNTGSCSNCGESFSVRDIIHGDKVNSSLHINNINESLAGIYDCNCQYENGTDRVRCFKLQIKNASCQLELTQHEKVKVFESSESQNGEAVRKVNVNTDDNVTARCVSDGAQLNTNCKNRSGLLKMKESQDRCRISCRIKRVCETRIILSVISSTINRSSTSMTTEEVTRNTNFTATKTSTVTLVTSPYTTDINSSLTPTMSEEEPSPRDQTKVNTPDDGIFIPDSTTAVTMSPTMIFVAILAAFIVILIFIVLVLSLKILKGKRKRFAEKEEWINPIYEGFDEGKEIAGSTEHERANIAGQPDQETLDEGVYHYVVTSNSKPIHES